jgi:cell division transport system permease protein
VSYALREALAAFRRVPVLTGLASAMVGLALFVVGLFALAAFNLEEALREAESRVEVVAYLRDDARSSEIDLAHRELASLPEVQEVHFVSKEMALESLRRDLPDLEGLFANMAVNPLPASLEIRLRPGFRTRASVEGVSALAASYPFVEDVSYGREWVERLFALRRVAGVTVAVMGAAFAVVAALIIGTALKIAVFARREEIYIMRLVGARDGFIRLPFLIEGAMAGFLGGLFAALLTYLTFRAMYSLLFQLSWIPAAWVLAGVTAGAAFGILASGFSVRRHLREV